MNHIFLRRMMVLVVALCAWAVPRTAEGQPPSLSVQLNANQFRSGDVLELRVSLLAGSQPAPADAYVVLEAPGPTYLSLQLGGSLVPGLVPIVRGFLPFDLTVPIWSVAIPPGTPAGDYRWLSAAVRPGTLDVFDGISEVRFRTGAAPGRKVFAGLNFSPWMFDQNPELGATVSTVQLTARLATIAPWTQSIRLFGSGGGLDQAPAIARSLGLQVACAAWLGPNAAVNDQELTSLEALGGSGACDLLVVGSETLFRGELSAAQLVAYITRVKNAVPAVPVTTSDTYGALSDVQNASVLAAVDVVMVTIYPFWEGVAIDQAVTTLAAQHATLAARVPGKAVRISETGWPTCGTSVGSAVPTPENAARYLRELLAWAHSSQVEVHYFSAFDEAWKAAGRPPREACWGVWDRLGNIKPQMVPVLFLAP